MNSLNKTFLPTKDYKNRNWFLIDCKGQTLGRLATVITHLLKGKIKSHYHPSIDIGDYIVLVNADSIIINQDSKHYFVSNPGRPGNSLKLKKVSDCLTDIIIKRAVKRMLSRTEAKKIMGRLKIYNDLNHFHEAQNPIKIDLNNLYNGVRFDIKKK